LIPSHWTIVGVVWLTLAIGYGLFFSFPIFFVPLVEEFRWSRALTAGAFSLSTVVQGVMSPVVGVLVDRLGPRRVLLAGAAVLGAAFVLASRIGAVWHLYLVTGVVAAVGLTGIGWVPTGSLLARWVSHHRGGVIGLAFSGMGIGVLGMGPLAQWLIATIGWRLANLWLGLGALAALLPLIWLGVRDAPATAPDPLPATPGTASAHAAALHPPGPGVSVREALGTGSFWALFLAYLFTPLAVFPVFTHQVAFAVDLGFSALLVAGIFGLMGLMSSVGRAVFGAISDRIGAALAATLSFGFTAGGTAALLALEVQPSMLWLYAYAVLFGLGFGARGPIITAIASRLFGGRRFGVIYGVLNMGNGIGAAIGPLFAGAVHDLTGSYRMAFVTAIGFCLAASGCFWVVGARRKT